MLKDDGNRSESVVHWLRDDAGEGSSCSRTSTLGGSFSVATVAANSMHSTWQASKRGWSYSSTASPLKARSKTWRRASSASCRSKRLQKPTAARSGPSPSSSVCYRQRIGERYGRHRPVLWIGAEGVW